LLKDVAVLTTPILVTYEEDGEPLALKKGTALAIGNVEVEVTKASTGALPVTTYTAKENAVCFLVIDDLGFPIHVPYGNVTFDTDEGGKIIC